MSSVKTVDFLRLLRDDSDFRSDLTIQFKDDTRTIRAHKQILSLVSKTFHTQFYGPMTQNAKSQVTALSEGNEIIMETKFTYDAYIIFVRHIYGDETSVTNCSNFKYLFQLLEMAKMYLMEELEELVLERIECVDCNILTLLPTLRIHEEFKNLDGFQEVCKVLCNKIIACFTSESIESRNEFYREFRKKQPDLVQALMDYMVGAGQFGLMAWPDHCLVDSNKLHKYYDEQRNNPEMLRVLDDIMCNVVIGSNDDGYTRKILLDLDVCTNCRRFNDDCLNEELVLDLPHVDLVFATNLSNPFRVVSVRPDLVNGYTYDVSCVSLTDGSSLKAVYTPGRYNDRGRFNGYTYQCERM